MIRRLMSVLLTFALLLSAAPADVFSPVHAQDGSPVAVEIEPEADAPVASQSDDPTATAAAGNTPAGDFTGVPIFPRSDVYFSYYRILTGGNTTVIDGGASFDAAGYRSDNAKVITIETSAVQEGNFYLCIIFDAGAFSNPAAVDMFRFDGSTWVVMTTVREGSTVCGYTGSFGVFAVAEPGAAPSPTATDVPPTATATATETSTTVPPTETATSSPTSTAIPPTETATVTSTATIIPPTETATASSTATSIPPTETATASSTSIPPSATPTSSSTPTTIPPSATPTDTASPTSIPPSATPSASASPTTIPPSTTPTASATQTAIPPTSTATETLPPSATTTATTLVATETGTSSETPTSTSSPSETSTSTGTATTTSTPSPTPSATIAPNPIQYALPNVYVTFGQIPTSGTTTGSVLSSGDVPMLPVTYASNTAWFFAVSSTVVQAGNKRLCVVFETASYASPLSVVLLQRNGASWTSLTGQVFDSLLPDQGTRCGYISSFGDFALVEQAVASVTATWTPSSTASATRTSTPSPTWPATHTATASPTATATSTTVATSTPSATVSPTSSASSTATQTASPSATNSSTPTLGPGSYPIGTTLRTTARVNVRTGPGTSSPSLGVVASGTIVTVTGMSASAGNLIWVPVTTSLGSGWIAGNYLAPVSTATPTRTPAPATVTRTPGNATATRTATRTPTLAPGGFVTGESVRTTARVNLRSGPNASSSILRVVPSKTTGVITGPGVVSGGMTFYPISISGYPAGYIAGPYLQRVTVSASPTRTSTPTVAGVTIRYTTANVNLRSGPGTSYRRIATILEGTAVNITGTPRRVNGTDWYPVIINGVGSGWISGAFLARTYEPV